MSAGDVPAKATGGMWRALRMWVSVDVGLLVMWALGRTWRYRTRNQEAWQRLRAEHRPFIFALWHQSILPLTYRHRDEGVTVLISEHRDGEIIARIVHAWGYRTIRGSTTRGAGRALLSMIRVLEGGAELAITPDGPRGPAFKFQPGALVAAHRAGVPIVPICMEVDRAWKFRSWDGFIIPKPFARVTIAYGEPTMAQGGTLREAALEAPRFETAMGVATGRANA